MTTPTAVGQAVLSLTGHIPCMTGKHSIRAWTDDTVMHVQLVDQFGAEVGHATFSGRDAESSAIMVATMWQRANA